MTQTIALALRFSGLLDVCRSGSGARLRPLRVSERDVCAQQKITAQNQRSLPAAVPALSLH